MATHSIFLPGEYHGQWSPVGCSPLGRKGSNMTEQQSIAHIHALAHASVHTQDF